MIYRSPFPDVEIPDVTVSAYVLARAAELGDKPALIDGPSGRTLTYADVLRRTRALAAGLARRGLRKGDVVALVSPNRPEYAVLFHAVAMAGGILSPANPLYTEDELTRQLAAARARFLVAAPQFVERARAAAAGTTVEEVFTLGETDGATPLESLFLDEEPPDIDIDPTRDVVVLPFSSGTTGLPKGVMLTHRNLVANICQIAPHEPISGDDVVLGILPFFHIYGLVVIMGLVLHAGGTIVTLPRFELGGFLDTLQDYRITRAHVVPPIILALAKHPSVTKRDLSHLRWIFSGAAPLGADVATACAERLQCSVRQGYGLTETSPATHIVPIPPAPQKHGSIGPPVPNTEVRIVDVVSGTPLPHGETGEIVLRGPQVMKGYLGNPTATSNMISPDGWLRTGDIGYADDDGYFFVVDRAKELIKSRGFQVPPAELEAVLLAHPAIADAAVIGVPDSSAGELPKAFVVTREPVTTGEILDFVAERVAPYKRLRFVEFRDSIPKSASGKILRRVLVAEERERG